MLIISGTSAKKQGNLSMAKIIEQTIKQKASFVKLFLAIFGTMLFISMVSQILGGIGYLARYIWGIFIFILAIIGCYIILSGHTAYFNYRLMGNDLVMEKVFGRASHLFLSVDLNEIDSFEKYKGKTYIQSSLAGRPKIYKFVPRENNGGWYVGEFSRSGERHRFIIEPNEELLNAIKIFIKNE